MYIADLAATFEYAWLGWLLLFVGIEGLALWLSRTRVEGQYEGGTLSELIWRYTRGEKNRYIRYGFFGAFTLLWMVLTYHFFLA